MTRPNILLLTLDTLRADSLGCYGHPEEISPHTDRLSRSGVRFDQAITGGSWTQAAFPVMLTSTYASMYGGCLGPLAAARPSPIAHLQGEGYATGGFSTSPLLSRAYGYDRGFDRFEDLAPTTSDPPIRKMKGGERLLRSPITHALSGLVGMDLRPARIYISAETLVDHIQQWLNQVDRPFFGWAHFMDIHWPYHREELLQTPTQIAQAWKDLAHLHGVNWHNAPISTRQRSYYRSLYERAVRYTDEQIGRLIAALDQLALRDNTIVVLVSDHGEEFLEHGRWGHFENNLHDEILKVPFLIHLPELDEAQVVSRQVSLIDLMPTILDLAGCAPLDGMEGRSLRPLWSREGESAPSGVALSEMWRDGWHIVSARTETYKYIWDSQEPDKPRLYDLEADPSEKHNLAERDPQIARRFQRQIDEHLSRLALTSQSAGAVAPEHDEEILRRLRDLGYVE